MRQQPPPRARLRKVLVYVGVFLLLLHLVGKMGLMCSGKDISEQDTTTGILFANLVTIALFSPLSRLWAFWCAHRAGDEKYIFSLAFFAPVLFTSALLFFPKSPFENLTTSTRGDHCLSVLTLALLG